MKPGGSVNLRQGVTYGLNERPLAFGTALAFLSRRHMRTTLIPTIKLALLCTVLAGAFLTFSASAYAFSIRDVGASAGSSDESTYVNHLAGMAVRSEERANVWSLRPDNLSTQMTDRNTAGSREIITIPSPGGGPGGVGGGVPDGGTTVMLLGAALGALGMARRYIRL